MNHKVNLLGYCNDCKVLLCSSCMIKDHKGHSRSEVYNQIEKHSFLEDWIKRLKMIREKNAESLLLISSDYASLVPNDLTFVDKYLYENNLVDLVTDLNFKVIFKLIPKKTILNS